MYGLGVGESLFTYEDTSMGTLRRAVDACVNEDSRGTVRFKSVVAYQNPIEVIDEVRYRLDDSDVVVSDQGDHYRIDLSRVIERSDIEGGQRVVEGSFALFRHSGSNIWTAVTGHGPDFYKRGLEWLFKRTEPDVSNFYIDSGSIRSVIQSWEHTLASDIQILAVETVAYSHTDEGNISYETRPYREAFLAAEEDNRYVDKIKFVARGDEERIVLKGFISRGGHLKLLQGSVSMFFDTILPHYATEGQKKVDVVTDKERSSETGEVNQIELNFEEAIFGDVSDNERLIKALEGLTNTNVTVYHNNPYAHVSVLDLIDGSSCDVFVTEPDTVSIVPSYKGSPNSLMRISEQLSRELDEGRFASMEQPDYEFADFFA